MTTRVESFEELVWSKRRLNGGSLCKADAGDALLKSWEHGACVVIGGTDRRFKYDLPDLPTAKRAAWHLLLELRAKASPPCPLCAGQGCYAHGAHYCDCDAGKRLVEAEGSAAKRAALKLATNLPAPNPLTPAELAEATAEGRACREALDRATVGMEGVQLRVASRGVDAAVLLQAAHAELAKLRAVIARVALLPGEWTRHADGVMRAAGRAGEAKACSDAADELREALGEYVTTADAGLLESARRGR